MNEKRLVNMEMKARGNMYKIYANYFAIRPTGRNTLSSGIMKGGAMDCGVFVVRID